MLAKPSIPQEHLFVILIPNRDTEKLLDEYHAALFAKGFCGAYSFPSAAPLAEISSPFIRDELKELAGNIRKLTAAHDGKISGAETGANAGFVEYSFGKYSFADYLFFGLLLNLPAAEELFPKTAKEKIIRFFSPPVLCAALVHPGENPLPKEGPSLSFRAAALANLTIRSLSGIAGEALAFSFEWEIGPSVWLPVYKKASAERPQ
jgi:hypothetical protein